MFHLKRYNKTEDNNPVLVGKEKELYESKNWPKSFSSPVDITRVKIDAFKPWITKRVSDLMGIEDDIVIDYFFNEKPRLDPKRLQISLTGFMEKKAGIFVRELWELLLSAQSNPDGIPQAFIDGENRENEPVKEEPVNHEKRETSRDSSHSSSLKSTKNHDDHRYSDYSEKPKREPETDNAREREDRAQSYRRHDFKREYRDRDHRREDSYKHRSERRERRRYKSSSRSKSPVRDIDSSESVLRSRSRSRDVRSRKHRRKSPSSSYEEKHKRRRRRRSVSSDSWSPTRDRRRQRERARRNRSRSHSRQRYTRKRDYSSSSSSLDPGT
eukprot:XP_764932.1 hypothetical protein [Theileria parva strain Muguga]